MLTGYQIFLEIKDMPATYEHFRTRLRLEQSRCLRWGEKVGLVEELLNEPSKVLQMNHNLVLDILHQIQRAFRSCLKTNTKFDHPNPAKAVDSPAKFSFLQKTLAVREKIGRVAIRLEWAMIRKDGVEQLIEQLVQYNDRIESLLDRNTLEDLRALQAQSNLALLQMTEEVSQLRVLVQALQIQSPTGKSTLSLSRSSTLLEREVADQTIIALAQFKAQHPTLLKDAGDTKKWPASRILLDELSFEADGYDSGRQLGKLGDKHVWLEWQDLDLDSASRTMYFEALESRIADLAGLLADPEKPPEFSSPSCLGYAVEEDRQQPKLALIFARPAETKDGYPEPVSLREMIRRQISVSLNARFELARTLAASVLYLHAVNWLHKGIRSDNVLFQPAEDRSIKMYEPVLTGYEHARPALPDEFSLPNSSSAAHDLYRHPDLLSPSPARTMKTHDIYSLGLVLAEIALWRPIEDVVGVEARKSKARHVRFKMLDPSSHVFSLIAESAGWTFADVIRACIVGGPALGIKAGANEEDPEVGAELCSNMHQKILRPLQGLKV